MSSIDRVSVFQPEFFFFQKKNRERVRKMSDKEKGKEVIEFTKCEMEMLKVIFKIFAKHSCHDDPRRSLTHRNVT